MMRTVSQPNRQNLGGSISARDEDVMAVILAHLAADKHNVAPLHLQLSNAIEQAVFSGQIPEGAALPSVRVLADRIGVSPNTVVKSYRKLSGDGWLRSVPKRGYFVTFGTEEAIEISSSTSENVQEMLRDALSAAQDASIPMEIVIRWVSEGYRNRDQKLNIVAVVGYRDAFLDQRVVVIKEAIKDLPFDVVAVPITGFEGPVNPSEIRIENVAVYVVAVGQVRRVATALGPEASRILPMTRRLRDDVRDGIATQPAWTRFGILSGSGSTAGRIRAALHRLHPCNVEPRIVLMTADSDAVDELIDWADVLVVGTTARATLRTHGYPSKPTIEMAYLPDDHTVRQLRSRLAAISMERGNGVAALQIADLSVDTLEFE